MRMLNDKPSVSFMLNFPRYNYDFYCTYILQIWQIIIHSYQRTHEERYFQKLNMEGEKPRVPK